MRVSARLVQTWKAPWDGGETCSAHSKPKNRSAAQVLQWVLTTVGELPLPLPLRVAKLPTQLLAPLIEAESLLAHTHFVHLATSHRELPTTANGVSPLDLVIAAFLLALYPVTLLATPDAQPLE